MNRHDCDFFQHGNYDTHDIMNHMALNRKEMKKKEKQNKIKQNVFCVEMSTLELFQIFCKK